MNITTPEQRLALRAYRQRVRITRSPLALHAYRLKPQLPFVKTAAVIVLYMVIFGFFFHASQREFEANTIQLLSRPEAVTTNTNEVKNTKPVAQTKAITKPSETPKPSPSTTSAEAGLPPFNDENESAPSSRQQYTASGYAFGHCTYYVASRRPIPQNWGNARDWLVRAQAAGFVTGVNPRPGAIAQTRTGRWGHVAYVERVEAGKAYISEYNYVGWNRLSYRWVDPSEFKYIY